MSDSATILSKAQDFIRKKGFTGLSPDGIVPRLIAQFCEKNPDLFKTEEIAPSLPESFPATPVNPFTEEFKSGISSQLSAITENNGIKNAETANEAAIKWAEHYQFDFVKPWKLATDMVDFAIAYADERIKSLPKPVIPIPDPVKSPDINVNGGPPHKHMEITNKSPLDPAQLTVHQARIDLLDKMENGIGSTCVVCDQYVKIYKRHITSSMAYCLILIYKSGKNEFFHVEDYLKVVSCPSSIRGDFAKLRFFGLIEATPKLKREDDSDRVGLYKITPKGVDFVLGRVTVPKSVNIFNNEERGFDKEFIDIKGALKKKFRYDDLMANK